MVWTAFKDAVKGLVEKILHPEQDQAFREKWNLVFVTSCFFAVLTDPFFLYVPVINQEMKCIRLHNNLKIAALIFRSTTDLIYMLNIIFQIYGPKKSSTEDTESRSDELDSSNNVRRRSYILLDIVAILPIPQVAILIYFTKMRGSRSLNTRKFLNFLVMIQYVPRVYRIFHAEIIDPLNRRVGLLIKAGVNFLMYIFSCHIMGGLWYFFSAQRMIACWQYACRNETGCKPGTFECHDQHTNSNDIIKLLNDACPINPSDETIFNFGIFLDALESGLVGSTDFFHKFSYSVWWGLRNLSSLGSNLEPSANTWEILFAALASVIGLLLFLYLIGKVQMYMQMNAQMKEDHLLDERKQKVRQKKGPQIEQWLTENKLPNCFKKEILEKVVRLDIEKGRQVDYQQIEFFLPLEVQNCITAYKHKLEEIRKQTDLWMSKKGIPARLCSDIEKEFREQFEIDMGISFENFISNYSTKAEIQEYLPYNRLKKLKVLEVLGDEVLKAICQRLKPLKPCSKITEVGKPLELILFTEGVLRNKTESRNLKAPFIWGEELLLWPSSTSFPAKKPISNGYLKGFDGLLEGANGSILPILSDVPEGTNGSILYDSTLVSNIPITGLVLTAADLESIFYQFEQQFVRLTSYLLTTLKKVPQLEFMDDEVLKAIFVHLKQAWPPVYPYKKNEPVTTMNFIIKGSVKLSRKGNHSEQLVLGEGQVYGEELLYWVLDTSFPTYTPLATHTAHYDDEVIQLYITAAELKSVANEFSSYFEKLRKESQPDLKIVIGITVIKRVPELQNLHEEVLEEISQKLQFWKFNAGEKIIKLGNRSVDRMLFVMRGKLLLHKPATRTLSAFLPITVTPQAVEKRWFGEELIDWLATTSDGTRPLSAYDEVTTSRGKTQLLVLMADDLEIIISNFRSRFI